MKYLTNFSRSRIVAGVAGAAALFVALLLMAPTGGFPVRPVFQEVTVRTAVNSRVNYSDTSQAANEKLWACGVVGLQFACYTRNDSGAFGANWLEVERSTTSPEILRIIAVDPLIHGLNDATIQADDSIVLSAVNGSAYLDNSQTEGQARPVAWAESRNTWIDATVTGCTTNPAPDVHYTRIENQVTLGIPVFSCTSNATTFTLTGAPTLIRPSGSTSGQCAMYTSVNNGANEVNVAGATMNTSGTLQFYRNGSLTGWTGSGGKGFNSVVYCTYLIDNT